MELIGKRAVVTGSTSGIGLAIAEALAMAGCDVVLHGLGDPTSIDATRSRVAQASGRKVVLSTADLSTPAGATALIEQAKADLGGVEILVNNAGIQHVSPIEDFPPEMWDKVLAINLSAAFHTTRLALPMMRAAGWGRIVNIASAHATVASPFKSAYVAAKHGMVGLSKVVALETAKEDITCNAVCPGFVRTPLVEGQVASLAQAKGIPPERVIEEVILAKQPSREFIRAEDLAAFVVFICSPAAKAITGAVLPMDGGWTAE